MEQQNTIDGSIYRIYKYCTGSVFQWGNQTWGETLGKLQNRSKTKKKKRNTNKASLTATLQKLTELSKHGVDMPEAIHRQLESSIRLREKMSQIYRKIPTASERDLLGHAWIIQQLKLVRGLFPMIREPKTQGVTAPPLQGFAALMSHDDDSDEERAATSPEPVEATKTTSQPPPPHNVTAPSLQDIKEEEKSFAIACAVADVVDTRLDIKRYWRSWATRDWNRDDNAVEVSELVAVSAFSDFAICMVKKLILETSVTYNVELLDVVLNNDCGNTFVGTDTDDTDDTLHSLCVIHNVLSKFDSSKLPEQLPKVRFGMEDREPIKQRFSGSLTRLKGCFDELRAAVKSKDVKKFTEIIVEYFFPLWIPYSKHLKGALPTSILLLEFESTGTVKLPLLMMMLALADSAFEQEQADPSRADDVVELISGVLLIVGDEEVYGGAYNWLPGDVVFNDGSEDAGKTRPLPLDWLDSIHEFVELLLPMVFLLPLWSGALLFHHLRGHLSSSIIGPVAWRDDILQILHIYHMLRVEGYLRRIPAIEDSLIRVYERKVFFRAGLPKRGHYTQNYQMALGYSSTYMARRGQRRKKGGEIMTPPARGFYNRLDTSMNAADLSKLIQLFAIQNIPIVNRGHLYKEIHRIAEEECPTIFMAPLMETFVRCKAVLQLYIEGDDERKGEVLAHANSFFARFPAPAAPTSDLRKISYWSATLGDNNVSDAEYAEVRTPIELHSEALRYERDPGLKLLAKGFEEWFDVDEVSAGDDVCFEFNETADALDKDQWHMLGAR